MKTAHPARGLALMVIFLGGLATGVPSALAGEKLLVENVPYVYQRERLD